MLPNAKHTILLLFYVIAFSGGCQVFKPKSKPQQATYIQAVINTKLQNFHYQIKGSYNKSKHQISLRGNDTIGFFANTIVLNVELGKDTTLAMLKFPRTFSAETDTLPKRQISFAGLHYEDFEENILYENYTYRRKSDLKITLISFSKDSFLQGNFSGTLFQNKKRTRIKNGKFAVYLKSY